MRKRNLFHIIDELALQRGKMAFISGPRQVGKTTLAKKFVEKKRGLYYNWDDIDFRRAWTKSPKSVIKDLSASSNLILDEIHKASKWKQNLKGVYDTLDKDINIIVTGSARLDIYKKGSDSLMGRYHGFRLHPFSLGEMLYPSKMPTPRGVMSAFERGIGFSSSKKLWGLWNDLFQYGGFPEPLLSSSQKILNLWRRGRIEKIVREDLRDLSRIPELSRLEMLISLLPERAANPLSLNSLREDLEVSYDTARRWCHYLRELYYHFEVKPWATNVTHTLKKESKLYLWDWSEIKSSGARFENIVASHLLKACHYWTDTGEGNFFLHYLKTKEKKEIDFLITRDNRPWLALECKSNQTTPSSHFSTFVKSLKIPLLVQLVSRPGCLERHQVRDAPVWVMSAPLFFRYLP